MSLKKILSNLSEEQMDQVVETNLEAAGGSEDNSISSTSSHRGGWWWRRRRRRRQRRQNRRQIRRQVRLNGGGVANVHVQGDGEVDIQTTDNGISVHYSSGG